MKKLLSILLAVMVLGLLLTGCQGKTEMEKAYYAACDKVVAENTDRDFQGYHVDDVSYKIHFIEERHNAASMYPNGYINVEIVWYVNISGTFDRVEACRDWTRRIKESLDATQFNGNPLDAEYMYKKNGDSFTVIVNDKYAYTEQDRLANYDYTHKPSKEPFHNSRFGIIMTVILFLVAFIAGGVGVRLKKWLLALVGAIIAIPCGIGAVCASWYMLNVIWSYIILALIALGIVTLVVWLIARSVIRKNDKLEAFYEECVRQNVAQAPEDERQTAFMAIAETYGYTDFKEAIDGLMKGKRIHEQREKRTQDKEFSVPLVTIIALAVITIIIVVLQINVPGFARWIENLHSSWIIMGSGGIIIGVYSIVFMIHYYISGEARREAEAREQDRIFWSKAMAQAMVMTAERGGDPVETYKELSGYNARVAQAEADEIIACAILGGAIGGATGAVIGATTAKQNIEARKR